jgi:hypothetical protein
MKNAHYAQYEVPRVGRTDYCAKWREQTVKRWRQEGEPLWVRLKHKSVVKKSKVVLALNYYAPRHEDVWGTGGIAPSFLTSALDGGEWSASNPGRFTPGERAPGTYCIEGWVGSGAGLDIVKKRKIFCPAGNLSPGRPARSPSLYRRS